MPQESNPTYEKQDADTGFLSITTNIVLSVTELMTEIANLQSQVDDRVAKIQGLQTAGVDNANDAITTLTGAPLSSVLAGVASLATAQTKLAQPAQM